MSFSFSGTREYDLFTNTAIVNAEPSAGMMGPFTGTTDDDMFALDEDVFAGFLYKGTINIGGLDYPVVENPTPPPAGMPTPDALLLVLVPDYAPYPAAASVSFPSTFDMLAGGPGDLNASVFNYCFAAGTRIETSAGEVAVEDLTRDHMVRTQDSGFVPVKWVGRQVILKRAAQGGGAMVRIKAGVLGDGLPVRDLDVTPDHGMVIDGVVINAGALVNGGSIDFVPSAELDEVFTVYHVETENHDVIFANGAAAETLIDASGRTRFQNYAEYLELFGVDRIVPEMDRPRISTARLVPEAIKARLGIEAELEARRAG